MPATVVIDAVLDKSSVRRLGHEIRTAVNRNIVIDPFGQVVKDTTTVKKNIQAIVPIAEKLGNQFGRTAERFSVFVGAAKTINTFITAANKGAAAAISFDRELVRLNQLGGVTASQIGKVSKEITRLATSFGVSSAQLAKASVTLRQAGLSIDDTRIALESLAKVSLAPTFDSIESATEGGIAAMQQFNLKAKDFEAVFDSINQISAQFAVESNDLVSAIKRAGGAFAVSSNSSGLKGLNELLSLFTAVRQTTRESADQIATGLRTVFTRVQRQDTVEQLRALGIELRDAKGQFVGTYEAFRRLSEGLKNIPTTDPRFSQAVEALGGYRQISRVIPLINQFSVAQRALITSQKSAGSLTDSALKAQGAYAVQLEKLNESFIKLFNTIAQNEGLKTFLKLVLETTNAVLVLAEKLTPLILAFSAIGAVKLAGNIPKFITGVTSRFASGGPVRKPNAMVMPGELIVPPNRVAGGELVKANATGKISDRARKDILNNATVVPGQGNSDNVPAFLPAGTFVIKKSSAQKIIGFAGGGRQTISGLAKKNEELQRRKAEIDGQPVNPKNANEINEIVRQIENNEKQIARLRAANKASDDRKRQKAEQEAKKQQEQQKAEALRQANSRVSKKTGKNIQSLIRQGNIPAAQALYASVNPSAESDAEFNRLFLSGSIPGAPNSQRNVNAFVGKPTPTRAPQPQTRRDIVPYVPPQQRETGPRATNLRRTPETPALPRPGPGNAITPFRGSNPQAVPFQTREIVPVQQAQSRPELVSGGVRRRGTVGPPPPFRGEPTDDLIRRRDRGRTREEAEERRARARELLSKRAEARNQQQLDRLPVLLRSSGPSAQRIQDDVVESRIGDITGEIDRSRRSKIGARVRGIGGKFGGLRGFGIGALASGAITTAQAFMPESQRGGRVDNALSVGAGVAGGAGLGASLGSFFGPIGTVAGGIAGGIAGGLKSLLDVIQSNSAEQFSKSVEKISTGITALGQIQSPLDDKQIATFKNLNTNLIKGAGGEVNKDNLAGFDAASSQAILQNIGANKIGSGLSGTFTNASAGSATASKEIEDAAKKIAQDLKKNFSSELIVTAKAAGVELGDLTNEISLNAAAQARANAIIEKEQEINRQLQITVTNQVLLYKGLATALSQAIISTDKFTNSLNTLESLSSGQSSIRSTNRFTQAAAQFGTGTGLISPLTNQLRNFGGAGSGLGNEAEFFDKLNRVLPSALAQVSATRPENPQEQLNKILQGEFGEQFNKFGSVFSRINDQISAFDLDEFKSRLEQAPAELARELTGKAGGDEISSILNDVAQGFETAVNRFGEGLNRNFQLVQQVNEAYRNQENVINTVNDLNQQVAESNLRFGQRAENNNITPSDIAGRRIGFEESPQQRLQNIFNKTGTLLDSDIRNENFTRLTNTAESNRRFLTGEFAPNIQASQAFSSDNAQKAFNERMAKILGPNQPVTAAGLAANLSTNQRLVRNRQEDLVTAQERGAPVEEINRLQEGISAAEIAANNASNALQELADVGARTAAIQKELADIEQARTAQNNVAEGLLRGGPGAARQLQANLQATQFFASRGQVSDFAGSPVLNRVLDFLDQNPNLRLQNGQGQFVTGQDLKSQFVSQAAGTFGKTGAFSGVFGGNLEERRLQLTDKLTQAGKEGVTAQDELTKSQENNQKAFFGTLQQQNQKFLDELKRIMIEAQIQRADKEINQAQGRLGEIANLQKQGDAFRAQLGTNTIEGAVDKVNNPAVQAVFQRQNKIDEVNARFDAIQEQVSQFDGPINKKNASVITGINNLPLEVDGFNGVARADGSITKQNLTGLVNQERNRQLVAAGASEAKDFKKPFFADSAGRGFTGKLRFSGQDATTLRENKAQNQSEQQVASSVLGFDSREIQTNGKELQKYAEKFKGVTTAQLKQEQTKLQEQVKVSQAEKTRLQGQLPQQQGAVAQKPDRAAPQAVNDFNKNMKPFAENVDKLSVALKDVKIPENIKLEYRGQVEVLINGADFLQKAGNIGPEVIEQIQKELAQLKSQIGGLGPNGEQQGLPQV